MINIHLYPSPFLNESRILREASTLLQMRLFDQIHLVGVTQANLPEREELLPGLRILRIGRGSANKGIVGKILSTLHWWLAVFQRYRRQPLACINCHSVTTLPLAVLLTRITGASLVYDTHELETETNGLHGFRKTLTKQVERALIGQADQCIFVGKAIEEWYVHEYALKNTAVVYNCPRNQQILDNNYFREHFGIAADKAVFLYQGLLAEGRGLRAQVDAFAGLADRAVLVVMGYGPLTAWCEEQAGLYENIYYHPAVPPEQLLRFTAAADYGLSVTEATSMSYEYCMPNKLFEYIMAGKPVLVSPTREQRSLVQQYGIGEVAQDATAEAVRDSAVRLLSRDRHTLSDAIERVRDEFSWERQEIVMRRIYMDDLGFEPRTADAQ